MKTQECKVTERRGPRGPYHEVTYISRKGCEVTTKVSDRGLAVIRQHDRIGSINNGKYITVWNAGEVPVLLSRHICSTTAALPQVDHDNQDTLDNRDFNLIAKTPRGNISNRSVTRKYDGVPYSEIAEANGITVLRADGSLTPAFQWLAHRLTQGQSLEEVLEQLPRRRQASKFFTRNRKTKGTSSDVSDLQFTAQASFAFGA